MIYIGIDPGKKGAVAIIDPANVTIIPWDDEKFVNAMKIVTTLSYKNKPEKAVAAVEKVGAMPHQGVKSMFSFGHSLGFIEGVLAANRIPYQLVPPAKWKKEFGLIGKDKREAIIVCKKLFPGINLLPTERCRTESDGMADALLMAEYARRKM